VSDIYCGECCIGDTRNPIAINEDITGCCLFEPKQSKKPKPLTNGDRIRQMTDEELADWITDGHDLCDLCQFSTCRPEFGCEKGVLEWLKQEVSEDAGTD
jgi:hypothetical protein